MEFHVLQSYLIRIHFPDDKGLHTGMEGLFFKGIGYWNSMFFNRRGTEKKSRELFFAVLCDFAVENFKHRGHRGHIEKSGC
jgi:hypothetical protein